MQDQLFKSIREAWQFADVCPMTLKLASGKVSELLHGMPNRFRGDDELEDHIQEFILQRVLCVGRRSTTAPESRRQLMAWFLNFVRDRRRKTKRFVCMSDLGENFDLEGALGHALNDHFADEFPPVTVAKSVRVDKEVRAIIATLKGKVDRVILKNSLADHPLSSKAVSSVARCSESTVERRKARLGLSKSHQPKAGTILPALMARLNIEHLADPLATMVLFEIDRRI